MARRKRQLQSNVAVEPRTSKQLKIMAESKRAKAVGRSDSPTKLMDLNDDCFTSICMHLNEKDLISCAKTNERLYLAAQRAFKSKYKDEHFRWIFTVKYKHRFERERCLYFWLDMLRYFGHLIYKLEVTESESRKLRQKKIIKLFDHINKYCAESLREVKFSIRQVEEFQSWTKPFSNVEIVHFEDCKLGDDFGPISKWFPKVKSLTLNDINYGTSWIHPICIKTKFEHLINLIVNHSYDEGDMLKIFQLNPHISNLKINLYKKEILQYASENLKQLESLTLTLYDEQSYEQEFHFDMLTFLQIAYVNNYEIPIVAPQLNELVIFDLYENDSLYNFFMKHQTITKLVIKYCENDQTVENLIESARILPKLKLLELSESLESSQAIKILNTLKSLKEFNFQLKDCFNFEEIKLLLNDKWHRTIKEFHDVEINRKS